MRPRRDLLIPTSARLRGSGSCNLKPGHCYPLHGNKVPRGPKLGPQASLLPFSYEFQDHNFPYNTEWVEGGGWVPQGDGYSLGKRSGGRASLGAYCALAPTWCNRARLMSACWGLSQGGPKQAILLIQIWGQALPDATLQVSLSHSR